MKTLARFLSILLFCTAWSCTEAPPGQTITLQAKDGSYHTAYVAGPENAAAGVLLVHDYFGMSDFTKSAVEHLASLGYYSMAVDLYQGQVATSDEEATSLMNSLDGNLAAMIIAGGASHLKHKVDKAGVLGFSMGGLKAFQATLEPDNGLDAATLIYGGGYDEMDLQEIGKLDVPVLTVAGSDDEWSLNSAWNLLRITQSLDKHQELYIYPNVGHAFAQPLFKGGDNYDAAATRAMWSVTEDFLTRHLK